MNFTEKSLATLIILGLPGEEPKKPGERRSYIDSIPCSACEETFSAENHYIQHYQTMHGDFPPEFEDREKFMCDQCPAIFLTKQKWTSHKWSVHLKKRKPVQRVQCPQCTKTYKNHSYLKEHILKVRKFQKNILMSSIFQIDVRIISFRQGIK